MRRYTSIDGLRAISVCLVIFFHAFFLSIAKMEAASIPDMVHSVPVLLGWVWHGEKGVDVFFVISGFLICTLLLGEQRKKGRVSLKAFYLKRFFRIFPAYGLLILVGVIASWPNSENYWLNLLFINNHSSMGDGFLPWTWSIAVEMQFYALFPLLFLVFSKYPKKLAVILLVLLFGGLIMRQILMLSHPELYQIPFYELMFAQPGLRARWFDWFYFDLWARSAPILMGILIALAYHAREQWFRRRKSAPVLLGMAGLGLVLGVSYVPYFDPLSWYSVDFNAGFNLFYLVYARPVFSLGISLIFISALIETGTVNPVHRFLSASAWQPLAKASYSMYLFHIPILLGVSALLSRVFPGEADWVLFFALALISIVLSLVCGLLLHRWVERPGINYSHRLAARVK